MKKPKTSSTTILNRRASFDYHLDENLTVGMSLSGREVRLIRDHHAQLKGSFVTIKNHQLFLNNLTLGAEVARNIPLLITKKQLHSLILAKNSGQSLVPVKILTGSRFIKLVIATGKGKKKYDKRQAIKHRDLDREQR